MCSEVRAPRCGLRVCEHRAESIGHSEKKEGEKMEGYDSGKVGNFDAGRLGGREAGKHLS